MTVQNICNKCGKTNAAGADYCVYCGNKLSGFMGSASAATSTELPCLVRVIGSVYGCVFGLLIGLLASAICVLPIMAILGSMANSDAVLYVAIALIAILVVAMSIMGISKGPSYFWKILKSIVEAIRALVAQR